MEFAASSSENDRPLVERIRRGELSSRDCPSREVLKHATSLWGVLALIALRDGTHRFSDLRRKVGDVSEKMLAQTLHALETDGFVERKSYPIMPPHVEYSLTEMGRELAEHVTTLAVWIETNLFRVMSARRNRVAIDQP